MPWSSQEAGNEDKLALIPSVESFVMCRLPGPDLSQLVLLQLSCPRFPESSVGRAQRSGGAWGELPIPAASPSRASLPRGLQGAEKAETAAHKNSFFSRLHLQPSPLKGTDGRALLSMGQLSETRKSSSRSAKCWAGITLPGPQMKKCCSFSRRYQHKKNKSFLLFSFLVGYFSPINFLFFVSVKEKWRKVSHKYGKQRRRNPFNS